MTNGSPGELEKLILKKNEDALRWDIQTCPNAKPGDISPAKLKVFLKASGLKYDSIENSLEKLKLINDGKLLNAALILFGKKPQSFFPNARLRCAVFGTSTTSFTIDMQDFYGDLFYLIEKAEEYILKNIHIGMKLNGLRRVDVPEINRDAFREAIINAFCHRDYREYDSVNIAVFKDRVEVRNPGCPYGGLTIEEITTQNVSKRSNELIADIFHRVHFVEKWGRGIELILSKEPEASFKVVADMFVSVFRRKEYSKTVEKTSDKTSDKIIHLIRDNSKISAKFIAKRIKITPRAVEMHLSKLKETGKIKRIGSKKGGHWEIIENLP